MKLRQAKKIMTNVRSYSGMGWVYGFGRIDIACSRMCRYYSKADAKFKRLYELSNQDPAAFLRATRFISRKVRGNNSRKVWVLFEGNLRETSVEVSKLKVID